MQGKSSHGLSLHALNCYLHKFRSSAHEAWIRAAGTRDRQLSLEAMERGGRWVGADHRHMLTSHASNIKGTSTATASQHAH